MTSKAEEVPLPVVTGTDKDYLQYSEGLLNVSSTQVTIRAVVSTVAVFAVMWALKLTGGVEFPGIGWILTLFLERSPIQYVTTLTFFSGLWFLILKVPEIDKEGNGFAMLNFPELAEWPYGADVAAELSRKIKTFPVEKRRLAIVRRFDTALERLVHTHDTSGVHDVLNTMSNLDREIADASYRSVRFAVWLIPVAGFLGTVLGISRAISGFAGIVGGEGIVSLNSAKPILAEATFNLGVAFDTTLLALVFSAILMLVMSVVQRREEVFLSAADEFCISEIINKTFMPDPGTTRILEGLGNLTGRMVDSVSELAGSIRTDFKKLAHTLDKRDEERIPELIETIQTRFGRFMDARDKTDKVFQTQLAQLLSHLSNIVDRGKAIEGFVAGLGELTNLANILESNQAAVDTMRETFEKLQAETRQALTKQQKEMKETLAELSQQTKEVLEEQQKQTRQALEQNKKAFDQLLPPLEELATGIKIKVGE